MAAGDDVEVMRLIADCLRAMDSPEIDGVTVFGGGARLPILRVDHAGGGRTYLTPEIGQGTSAPVRAGFIDYVTGAINAAQQSTIVSVGSTVTMDAGPTGLRVTTADGWDLLLRAMSVDVPGEPTGRLMPPALFGEEIVDQTDA